MGYEAPYIKQTGERRQRPPSLLQLYWPVELKWALTHYREDNAVSMEKFQKFYKSRKNFGTLEQELWNIGTWHQPGTPEHLEHWNMELTRNSNTSLEHWNTWNIGTWYQSGTLIPAWNTGTTGTLEHGTNLEL